MCFPGILQGGPFIWIPRNKMGMVGMVLQIHFYIQNAMKADFLEDKITIGDLAKHEMPVLNHLPAHETICCLKINLSQCGDVC